MRQNKYTFIQKAAIRGLNIFFKREKSSLNSFGTTVNQTFEAYVLAKVIKWYQKKGWTISYNHPNGVTGRRRLKLKFSTRGAPGNYTYVIARKGERCIQIHHQLRVKTRHSRISQRYRANICCDVAIIREADWVGSLGTDDAVDNEMLLSFGEAKHMSAYAELVAGFIGMVHELKPDRLRRRRIAGYRSEDLSPFMYVSGYLFATAKGIEESIKRRRFDIDIYSFDREMAG